MDNANSSTTAQIPNNNPRNSETSGTRDTPTASNASAPQNSTPSASSNIALVTNTEIPLNPERIANLTTDINESTIGKSQSSDGPRPRKKLKGTMVDIAQIGSRPPPAVEKGKEPMPTPPQPNESQSQTPLSGNSGGPSRFCTSQAKPPPDDNSGKLPNPPESQAKPPLDGNGGESSKRTTTAKDLADQNQQPSEKRQLLDAVEEIRADLEYAAFRLQDLTVSISQLREDDDDVKGEAYWKEQVGKLLATVKKGDMEMSELRGRAARAEARVKELESVKKPFGSANAPTSRSDIERRKLQQKMGMGVEMDTGHTGSAV